MDLDSVTTTGDSKQDDDTMQIFLHDPDERLNLDEEALAEIMFLPTDTQFPGELRIHPKYKITMRYFDCEKYQYDCDKKMLGGIAEEDVFLHLITKKTTGDTVQYTIKKSTHDQPRKDYQCLKEALLEMPQFPKHINPAVKQMYMQAGSTHVTIYMYCSHINCHAPFTVDLGLEEKHEGCCLMLVNFEDNKGCWHVNGKSPTRPVVVRDPKIQQSCSVNKHSGIDWESYFCPQDTPSTSAAMAIANSSAKDVIAGSVHSDHIRPKHFQNKKAKQRNLQWQPVSNRERLMVNVMCLANEWYDKDLEISELNLTNQKKEFRRMVGWIHNLNPLLPIHVSVWHRSAHRLLQYFGMFLNFDPKLRC